MVKREELIHHSSLVGNRVLSSVKVNYANYNERPPRYSGSSFGGSYAGAYGGSPYGSASIGDCGYGGNLLVLHF
ncbi:hypothetical protein P8452_59819 [Trifolium repens]|jgi:hypothetical protein|nr:hypothetical protein P8452_59819 [Trifolium repens]